MEASARLTTPLHVLPTPGAIGEYVADLVLSRLTGKRFLLGCPTGRTPQPIYAALSRYDLSNVVFVMMDEYVPAAGEPWSCHAFVHTHMSWAPEVWFPDPRDPSAYEARIADAGGIDFFLLASGASDGHVGFNQPGSPRNSRTRILPLSETTRRDSPNFEHLPLHGVTVGIETIAAAREAVMVVWGPSKRLTLNRIIAAEAYDPSWPATVIHECAVRQIVCDAEAAARS